MAGNLVSNLLGLNNSGLNYGAGGVPIGMPMSFDQNGNPIETGAALSNANSGLAQQQAFLNALQAQNGLANQSSVFNQQQGLANQLQGLANGVGPNPAMQQLQNTTGQNMANQAALMASQRGSGANAGLMARQAAMQGGALQQQAAGQGALMSAQQQIAGMQALQAQQNMMGGMANQQVGQYGNALAGYNQAAQSEQQNLLNSLAQYNNANVAMKSNMNTANAHIAGITGNGQLGLVNQAIGGVGAASAAVAKMFGGQDQKQQGMEFSPTTEDWNTGSSSGGASGGSNQGGHQVMAHGGMVQGKSCYACGGSVNHYAEGGEIAATAPIPMTQTPSLGGPQSFVGRFLYGSAPLQQSADLPSSLGSTVPEEESENSANADHSESSIKRGIAAGNAIYTGIKNFAKKYGGSQTLNDPNNPTTTDQNTGTMTTEVPAIPIELPGGKSLPGVNTRLPQGEPQFARGGPVNMTKGKMVPGKAKVQGDSLKNDTVPAMLSPGEVVIPRHVMQSKDPVGNAAKFVQAVLAHQNMRKQK